MTSAAPLIAGPGGSWRPLAPFAALFVLLMLFAVGGMLVIAYEADRSDAARAREAVTRSFLALQSRLDAAVEMNADAPPIASALSGPRATPSSVHGYLNFTSREALGYHGAVVLNHDGSAFAGTRFGLPWHGPTLTAAARIVAPFAARLPARGAGTVHAVTRDGSGRTLAVSVTNVVPTAPASHAGQAEPQRRLAMIAPIAVQIVPKMLPQLGVEGFRIVAAGDDANKVTIPVERGPPLVFAWRPRTPGLAAIWRWAPAIAAMLVTALVMLALAGRANLKAMRALDQLARRDSLTGLANRLAFTDELHRRLARGDAIALGMVDLNDFKDINDAHGHSIGDEVLRGVAMALASSAGTDDVVARLGGDEFAWISPSREAAERLSADFDDRIAHPLQIGDLCLTIGAAIGIAAAGRETEASALMAFADARLYQGKRASRSRRNAPNPEPDIDAKHSRAAA